MSFLQIYGKELFTLFTTVLTWWLRRAGQSRAKLVWVIPHSHHFLTEEAVIGPDGNATGEKVIVRTASLKVINIGRLTATKIELVFNFAPHCINFWPIRDYERKSLPDGRCIFVFPSLSPKEEIGLEILNVRNPLPDLITVRSDQCVAGTVELQWIERVADWKKKLVVALVVVGFASCIYWTVVLIQLLVLKTPI